MAGLKDVVIEVPPRAGLIRRLKVARRALWGYPIMFRVALIATEPIHLRHFDHGSICNNVFNIPPDEYGRVVYINGDTPPPRFREMFRDARPW